MSVRETAVWQVTWEDRNGKQEVIDWVTEVKAEYDWLIVRHLVGTVEVKVAEVWIPRDWIAMVMKEPRP